MKRVLSLILALVMLLGMVPMQVFAAENTDAEENLWRGRNAVFVGDSITAGSGTDKIYYKYLTEMLGFGSVTGMGIGGSCISTGSDYNNRNTPLINRYKDIPSADLIQIFMGTNDYGHATPIGTPEDTQAETFYGALNTIIPYLLETHRDSTIVFVTPLHRNAKSTGTTSKNDYDPNASGHTLGDYVEAMKQVCATHGVPVIDLYTESESDPRLDPKNTEYFPDGLHPNAAGHELIAGIMASHIREYKPVKSEPVVQTELIQGNKFSTGNNQPCRASSRANYYLKAGTVITLKNPDMMQWACARTSNEFSSDNLGYFPEKQWTDIATAVVATDGWIGFTFKYRDETQSFDLTTPLSAYIAIEEPHSHTYTTTVTAPTCTAQGYTTYTCECGDSYADEYVDAAGHTYANGICTGCGVKEWDTDGDGALEILAIGNSFSVDALEYAYQIAQDLGIEDIVIGNLYIGGCTLATHAANAAGDLGKYTYYYNDNGSWISTGSYKISTALASRSWDYVSLQQGSPVSGVASSYNDDLTDLIAYVQGRSDARLVWHMTWAYQQNSTHSAFPTYGKDQMTMYNAIVAAVQSKIVTNDHFDLLVPNGTAVQNSRTSLLGDTTTRDGYHMSYDYGRYLTGLLFVKTVTGLDISHITYAPSGVDAEEKAIAIESVNNAAAKPFEVTKSKNTNEVPEEGYLLLQTPLYQGAFWHPQNSGRYNELIDDQSNSPNFFTTVRFTREMLPVGSILTLESGWQYRPDGWVTDALQTGTRESATTKAFQIVTEDWWKDYTIRSFNVSRTAGGSVMNLTEEEMRAIFRIYVPEEKHSHEYAAVVTAPTCTEQGCTTYTCTLCGSSYAEDYAEATGHTYENGICTGCGEKENLHIHSYVPFVTEPTCTEYGYTTHICECGDSYVDNYTDATGEHSYEHGICSVCGSVSEEIVAAGTCGDALTWTLDQDGVLAIRGTGEMYDYGYRAGEEFVVNPPWNACKNEILMVVIGDGITTIGNAAFADCANLTGIAFADTITDIGSRAFSNCSSLANVTLPENLNRIESFAFNGCSSMESLRIPAGVTAIGTHAFSNCSGLTAVGLPAGIAQISERTFNNCHSLTAVTIPAGVTGIGDYAFFGCKNLETVELPNGLVTIGEYAFGDCAVLTDIVLPESLTGIGSSAFSACSSLTAIRIPDAVTDLGNSVFYNCYNLKNVTLPATITSIGTWVFYGCGLTDIVLPDSVASIGDYAFYSCDHLTGVEIPENVVRIGIHAFCDCIRLTSIKLPAGLESIGSGAFATCSSLDKITFTGDAPSIAESAFADVAATVYYPAGNATWTAAARQDYGANVLTWTSYCEHTYENGICTGCGKIVDGGIWQIVENDGVIGAFADLQSAIDACAVGGTVRLTENCAVTSGVKIKKDITIDGGNFLVDISGCVKEFIRIEKNVAVTLRDLKLDGGATGFEVDYDAVTYTNYTIPLKAGSADHDPMAETSAILSFGKQLICENVDIANRYTASYGAAMQIRSGHLELTDCDFTHNYGSKQGGALYIANSFGTLTEYPIRSVTIRNCTFTENYSGHGGAIYAMNAAQITIADSVFDRNTANGGKGGAIDLPGQNITKPVAKEKGLDYVQTTISNCVFSNNWAGNDGFAIQSYDAELYITDTDFIGNVGVHPTSSVGAVSVEHYRGDEWPLTVQLDGCLFEGNRGPCAAYGDHDSPSELEVTDCVFRGNKGNMSALLYASVSSFTNCQFVNETMAAAVIDARSYSNYRTPPKMTLTDVTFTGCKTDAEILIRKQDHNDSLNTYQVVLQGSTNGDIIVQDGNRVAVEGIHTGHVVLDRVTDRENLTVAADAVVNGILVKQPADTEAKMGERYCITAAAEGSGLKYQWYFRNPGSVTWYKSSVKDSTYDDVMTAARAGREVYCIITDARGNAITTDTAKLICLPSAKLEIITQPTDAEASPGERYCVTVEARGEGLKYQWYFRNKGTNYWTKSSVTDNTYDDVMTAARAGREVYCIITDASGSKVTTEAVKLIQTPAKLEIVTPLTDASAPFGEMFCAAVEAKGEGLKYQWHYRNAGSSVWHISGVRDNTYDDVMTTARNGREIYCVITDKHGNSITTDTVTLTAVPFAELELLGQTYESAAMGERYCVTVEAEGDGLLYQWYFRNAGSRQWYKSGVTDNTYDDVMTKARANREVYCIITDAFGNTVTTEPVTLTLTAK